MRTRVCAVICCGWVFCVPPALADSDSGTVVAIPGRPDVPVIVNPYGFDASYAIIEGEFGLNKPSQNNAQIIVPSPLPPIVPARRFYFPHADSAPAYGRFEVAPPPGRRVTETPQSYNRSWGAASDPLPASTDPPYPISIDASPYAGPWGPGRRHHGWDHGGGHRGGGRR